MNRFMHVVLAVGGVVSVAFAQAAHSGPILMSAEWAEQTCEGWNQVSELTDKLAESGWAGNDKERGYKIMHLYRTDCEESPRVELRISLQEGKAQCVYGGAVENEEPDESVDYIMHAKTKRWLQMGAGEYGPMFAMMLGRLKFTGPNWEAMKNMGPFSKFLLLTGSVDSDSSACP